jgi:hypothetical protein
MCPVMMPDWPYTSCGMDLRRAGDGSRDSGHPIGPETGFEEASVTFNVGGQTCYTSMKTISLWCVRHNYNDYGQTENG